MLGSSPILPSVPRGLSVLRSSLLAVRSWLPTVPITGGVGRNPHSTLGVPLSEWDPSDPFSVCPPSPACLSSSPASFPLVVSRYTSSEQFITTNKPTSEQHNHQRTFHNRMLLF